ncbi:hypothetical protein BD779DRAFT_540971 [Infundibulicybe gibba]|nr:hypothetical protein BD779DRAFT_540971 [Infundibulicybe gibba]
MKHTVSYPTSKPRSRLPSHLPQAQDQAPDMIPICRHLPTLVPFHHRRGSCTHRGIDNFMPMVIVDMDLSDEKILSTVMAYLKDRGDGIPPGKELWLRDMGSCEDGFVPLRWLVDHAKQSVIFDSSQEANGDRGGYHTYHTDDQLDAEYRYWSFMKTHPAHASLPPVAHQYAMAALDWDSTNGLIHPHSSLPTFTQEECQVFTALLQSIHERGETPLRTRMVSKILLRVVRWNQSHSRPDKPLPVDAGCYGPRWTDDSMLAHSGSPSVLTTGVHACLAAVIALSPSKIARITGVGALLFSLSSNVVSNAAIVTQFKMDSNGSLTSRARRAMSMFSPVANPWPPWRMAGVPSGRSSTLDTVPTTGENST